MASSANVTGAPNSRVTGENSAPSAMTVVLAIRLTPSGALSRSVISEKSPCSTRESTARNHS